MDILRRIGGLSKMIDNHSMATTLCSALIKACVRCFRQKRRLQSAAVTFLFRRFSWRCVEPALFVRTSSLAGPISMLTLSAKSFLVS